MYNNYGDVALNLSPTWDRSRIHNKESIFTTVGHREGVSDAYVTEQPEARHQFYWVEPNDRKTFSARRIEGYRFVTRDQWTINEDLWEWTADGRAQFGIEVLMARPAALYYQSQEKLQKERDGERSKVYDDEVRRMERTGVTVTDDSGQLLKRSPRRAATRR